MFENSSFLPWPKNDSHSDDICINQLEIVAYFAWRSSWHSVSTKRIFLKTHCNNPYLNSGSVDSFWRSYLWNYWFLFKISAFSCVQICICNTRSLAGYFHYEVNVNTAAWVGSQNISETTNLWYFLFLFVMLASTWSHMLVASVKPFWHKSSRPLLLFTGWTWHDIVAMWPAGGCI